MMWLATTTKRKSSGSPRSALLLQRFRVSEGYVGGSRRCFEGRETHYWGRVPPKKRERGTAPKIDVDFAEKEKSVKRKVCFFSFFSFSSLSLSLKMTDASGQGAERAPAGDVVACDHMPPHASGRGGGHEEVRELTSSIKCSFYWLAFFFFNAFFGAHLSLVLSLSLSLRNTQGAANGVSPPVALAWTGERRVKKPKKKKLLAEAMATAAATTTAGVDALTTAAAAVTPTSTSSAQLAAAVYGEGARASVELRRERAIRLEDVQNLVLWVLGEGSSPRWAFVKVREREFGGRRGKRRRVALVAAADVPLLCALFHAPTHSLSFAHSLDRTRP